MENERQNKTDITERFVEGRRCRLGRSIGNTKGNRVYRYEDNIHSGEVAQCANLIKSIRQGEPINECKRLAESTMTVILGRMSAYTGRAISWKWALKSKLDLSPAKYELGDLPVRPVAVPGKVPLI